MSVDCAVDSAPAIRSLPSRSCPRLFVSAFVVRPAEHDAGEDRPEILLAGALRTQGIGHSRNDSGGTPGIEADVEALECSVIQIERSAGRRAVYGNRGVVPGNEFELKSRHVQEGSELLVVL